MYVDVASKLCSDRRSFVVYLMIFTLAAHVVSVLSRANCFGLGLDDFLFRVISAETVPLSVCMLASLGTQSIVTESVVEQPPQ